MQNLCQYIFWDIPEWSQFFVWLYMLCYSHIVFPHIFSCLHYSLLRGLFLLSLSDPSDYTHIRISDISSFKERIFFFKDQKPTKNSVLNTYKMLHYKMYVCTQEIFWNVPTSWKMFAFQTAFDNPFFFLHRDRKTKRKNLSFFTRSSVDWHLHFKKEIFCRAHTCSTVDYIKCDRMDFFQAAAIFSKF